MQNQLSRLQNYFLSQPAENSETTFEFRQVLLSSRSFKRSLVNEYLGGRTKVNETKMRAINCYNLNPRSKCQEVRSYKGQQQDYNDASDTDSRDAEMKDYYARLSIPTALRTAEMSESIAT